METSDLVIGALSVLVLIAIEVAYYVGSNALWPYLPPKTPRTVDYRHPRYRYFR